MSLPIELRRAAIKLGGELAVTLEQAADELERFEFHKAISRVEQTFENIQSETASSTRNV
jgi:hypothetical protein